MHIGLRQFRAWCCLHSCVRVLSSYLYRSFRITASIYRTQSPFITPSSARPNSRRATISIEVENPLIRFSLLITIVCWEQRTSELTYTYSSICIYLYIPVYTCVFTVVGLAVSASAALVTFCITGCLFVICYRRRLYIRNVSKWIYLIIIYGVFRNLS